MEFVVYTSFSLLILLSKMLCQLSEQPTTEVRGDDLELNLALSELVDELLAACASLVLQLCARVEYLLELVRALGAPAGLDLAGLALDAGVVEGVAAEEVDGGQHQLLLAVRALLLGEGLRSGAQVGHLLGHLGDLLHILIDLLLGLLNDLVLGFQTVEEVLAEHLEFKVLPGLHYLQHQQWAQYLLLPYHL